MNIKIVAVLPLSLLQILVQQDLNLDVNKEETEAPGKAEGQSRTSSQYWDKVLACSWEGSYFLQPSKTLSRQASLYLCEAPQWEFPSHLIVRWRLAQITLQLCPCALSPLQSVQNVQEAGHAVGIELHSITSLLRYKLQRNVVTCAGETYSPKLSLYSTHQHRLILQSSFTSLTHPIPRISSQWSALTTPDTILIQYLIPAGTGGCWCAPIAIHLIVVGHPHLEQKSATAFYLLSLTVKFHEISPRSPPPPHPHPPYHMWSVHPRAQGSRTASAAGCCPSHRAEQCVATSIS